MDFERFQVQAIDAAIGDGFAIGRDEASCSSSVSRGKNDKGNVFALQSIVKTQKGKPLYIDSSNFEYNINKIVTRSDGSKQYNLRCNEYKRQKCKSVARFYDDKSDSITVLVDHNHFSDAAEVSAKLLVRKYVDSAVANPTLEPRTVYGQMMASRVLLCTERMCIPDRVPDIQLLNYCILITLTNITM